VNGSTAAVNGAVSKGVVPRTRDQGFEFALLHQRVTAVSREPRLAKTDRLDTDVAEAGLLGVAARGLHHGARVPTIAEEDAKRPNRERECLVGERRRIVNRMKGTLARVVSLMVV
jgi:transposase